MYLLFDIGGTRFRYAVSHDGKGIEEPVILSTPETYEKMLEMFREIYEKLPRAELRAVALGIAGSQDKEHTRVLRSKNLPWIMGMPLKEDLEHIFGSPVFLENDAALAGVGEAVRGSGKGHSIMAYMTVSTGVGGVRIVHGKLDSNAMGFEPGKQIIEQGKTLEQWVSGADVQKRYGKDPREIVQKDIWEELARQLAVGLHNTILHWSPDIVVLGGSMVLGNPAIPLERVKEYLKEISTIFPELPLVEKAALGDAAGLYGALEFAKQYVQAN